MTIERASGGSRDYASDSLDPPTTFKAKKLGDGRVLVEDVPVFAECDARYTPDGKLYAPPIGLPWLKGAFSAFQRNPGYWAPLHGDHHTGGILEGTKDRERFGEFRGRSVRLMRVDGGVKWVFTADYLFDDEEKAKRSNRFPYQSVEIVNEKPDEINSVALLSDKAPFVRFPNRRVDFDASGRRICYATAKGSLLPQANFMAPQSAVEFAPEVESYGSPDQPRAEDGKWGGGGSSGSSKPDRATHEKALANVEGKQKALSKKIADRGTGRTKEDTDEFDKLDKAHSHIRRGLRETPAQDNSAAFAAETEEHMADDKKPEDEKPTAFAAEDPKSDDKKPPVVTAEPGKPAPNDGDRMSRLEKGMEEMRATVAKLCSSMSMSAAAENSPPGAQELSKVPAQRAAADKMAGEEEGEERGEGQGALAHEVPAEAKRAVPPSNGGNTHGAKPPAPVVAAQVQLAAEVDTLKAKLEDMERSQKREGLVRDYSTRLEPFGLTTGRKQRLASFVENDLSFGTTFAEQYVRDTEARAQRVSSPNGSYATQGSPRNPAADEIPAELRSYAAEGADKLAWARAKFVEFKALEAAGVTGEMTLASFIKNSADSAPRS